MNTITTIPTIGRIVIYNHPGSADGKYAPTQSPAIIRAIKMGQDESRLGATRRRAVSVELAASRLKR